MHDRQLISEKESYNNNPYNEYDKLLEHVNHPKPPPSGDFQQVSSKSPLQLEVRIKPQILTLLSMVKY